MRLTARSSATWPVAGAAVLWTIALASYLATPVAARLVRVVPDDALFYLVLARNGAAGARMNGGSPAPLPYDLGRRLSISSVRMDPPPPPPPSQHPQSQSQPQPQSQSQSPRDTNGISITAKEHKFCFGCPIETDHRPVVCGVATMWMQKCRDDSETANWIKSNTKECTKCQSTIEKNGGCK